MSHPKDHFECLGYFEELIDADSYKFYGTRDVERPDRPLGYPGKEEMILLGDIRVKAINGFKDIKFSRPTKVYSILQMYCGKMHNPINKI